MFDSGGFNIMKLKKLEDKIEVKEVQGQGDCFNDCKKVTYSGNRNSSDNQGRCTKHTAYNCSFTCDW